MNPNIPAGPTPIDQIIVQEIASVHALVNIINANAISHYNLRKQNIALSNAANPPNIPPTPPPDPPMIYLVNEEAVRAGELANYFDLTTALIPIKYVDPNPTPVAPAITPIILDLSRPVAPGVFRPIAGNAQDTVIEFPAGSGHRYARIATIMFGVVYQQVS